MEDSATRSEQFDAFRLELAVARTAHMTESEAAGRLVRIVRIDAEARLRQPHAMVDSWKPVEIVCEQHDEELPSISVAPAQGG